MKLAVVKSYDYLTKTATVITVDKNPVEFHDISCWSVLTDDVIFNIPLTPGTSGLLVEVGGDLSDYLFDGTIKISKIKTGDEWKTSLFIPGFNSFKQVYDVIEDGIHIERGDLKLFLRDDSLNLSIDDIELRLTKGGKIAVENDTTEILDELIGLIEDILDYISESSIHQYSEMGTPAPCTPNIPVQEPLLLALNVKLDKIKSFRE